MQNELNLKASSSVIPQQTGSIDDDFSRYVTAHAGEIQAAFPRYIKNQTQITAHPEETVRTLYDKLGAPLFFRTISDKKVIKVGYYALDLLKDSVLKKQEFITWAEEFFEVYQSGQIQNNNLDSIIFKALENKKLDIATKNRLYTLLARNGCSESYKNIADLFEEKFQNYTTAYSDLEDAEQQLKKDKADGEELVKTLKEQAEPQRKRLLAVTDKSKKNYSQTFRNVIEQGVSDTSSQINTHALMAQKRKNQKLQRKDNAEIKKLKKALKQKGNRLSTEAENYFSYFEQIVIYQAQNAAFDENLFSNGLFSMCKTLWNFLNKHPKDTAVVDTIQSLLDNTIQHFLEHHLKTASANQKQYGLSERMLLDNMYQSLAKYSSDIIIKSTIISQYQASENAPVPFALIKNILFENFDNNYSLAIQKAAITCLENRYAYICAQEYPSQKQTYKDSIVGINDKVIKDRELADEVREKAFDWYLQKKDFSSAWVWRMLEFIFSVPDDLTTAEGEMLQKLREYLFSPESIVTDDIKGRLLNFMGQAENFNDKLFLFAKTYLQNTRDNEVRDGIVDYISNVIDNKALRKAFIKSL